jgi:hypothetical protein
MPHAKDAKDAKDAKEEVQNMSSSLRQPVHNAFDAILEKQFPKVDQKPQFPPTEPKLRSVNQTWVAGRMVCTQ